MDPDRTGTTGAAPAGTQDPPEESDPDPPPYTFDQLDARAKEVARERWRRLADDDAWWESTYEDAVTVGSLIGIVIGCRGWIAMSGHGGTAPDISFALYCQGGGACFSGTLEVALLNGAPARLATHVGNDETLAELAARGQALYDQIALRRLTWRLLGRDPDTGPGDPPDDWGALDEVTPDAELAIIANERHYTCRVALDDDDGPFAAALTEYVNDFAGWLADQLEAEDLWRNSDEQVDEDIRANEPDEGSFDADGHPW